MGQTPEIPPNCQWAIFLRNHDELTLEMVTERERDYLYRTYAADRQMRINLGIRRRLAPLMDNNRPKIELLKSLLMSMIGSPVLYYGDEIGMGDNIFLGDRNGVRTPMQWSPDRNAGFSRADPQRLYLPPIMDPVYGFAAVNVEAQSRSTASLLNWTKRLIAARKAHAPLSRGSLRFLRPGNRKVIAYLREHDGQALLCVANLARSSQPVELDLREFKGRIPLEVLGNTAFPPVGELPYLLTLPPWGFYWFSLTTDAEYPKWHVERPVNFEFPVLVIPEGLMAALSLRDPERDRPQRAPRTARARAARARSAAADPSAAALVRRKGPRHRASRTARARRVADAARQLASRLGRSRPRRRQPANLLAPAGAGLGARRRRGHRCAPPLHARPRATAGARRRAVRRVLGRRVLPRQRRRR